MGFNAGRAVEPLDYDFTDYVEDCKGIIPEPTQDVVDGFWASLRDAGKAAGIAALADADEDLDISAAVDAAGEDSVDQVIGGMARAAAILCQGTPSEGDIFALPVRVRVAFVEWLTDELARPTRPHAGMRGSLAHANGASGPT